MSWWASTLLGPSWGPLGALLERIWRPLGGLLGAILGVIFCSFWAFEAKRLQELRIELSWCVSDAPGTPQGTPKTTYFGVIFWFHDPDEDDNSLFHEIWVKFDVSSLIFLKVRLCQTSISLENSRGFKGLAACDMGSKQGDEYKLSLIILQSFWGHFRAQNRSKIYSKGEP